MAFNRLNDLYFKQLLGDEKRKNLTLNFLNDILDRTEENQFTDIIFKDKDAEPDSFDGKLSKLDICAKLNDGSLVDIEVQVAARKMFFERALFYWSNLYGSELPAGGNYTEIGKTISIILTNFDCLRGEPNWHTPCYITSAVTGQKMTDYFAIHFLELPKFKFTDILTLRRSERWMAYFSNRCSEKELEELAMKDETIKQVLAYEKYFRDNPAERRKYEQRQKAILDYNSDIAQARAEGEATGEARGEVNGKVKMLQQIMASMGMSFSEAMERMHIPPAEQEQYRQYLDSK